MLKNAMFHRIVAGGLLILTTAIFGSLDPARGADHRDAPLLQGFNTFFIGNLDLNDQYVFRGGNPANTVLVMTTGPATGVVSPPIFFPGGVYEFRIDNTGDFVDDLVIQIVFSDPDQFLRQTYFAQLVIASTGQTFVFARGITGVPIPVLGSGAMVAGIFDDPFFFNGAGYSFYRSTTLGEQPLQTGQTPLDMLVPPAAPVNTFGNFNTLAIVLEVPSHLLVSSPTNPNIGVWSRTLSPEGFQMDRVGFPGINTAAVPTALQGIYNTLTPQDDFSLRTIAADFLVQLYPIDAGTAAGLAATVLPDVLPFNVTSSEGFNDGLTLTLNGRKLADDVIDAEFNALTNGALTTDFVVNDSLFRAHFPYLGPPLPLTIVIPNSGATAATE